jgi:hypothetical protein
VVRMAARHYRWGLTIVHLFCSTVDVQLTYRVMNVVVWFSD